MRLSCRHCSAHNTPGRAAQLRLSQPALRRSPASLRPLGSSGGGSDTKFAMSAGGGLDIALAHGISIRPIQAEYVLDRACCGVLVQQGVFHYYGYNNNGFRYRAASPSTSARLWGRTTSASFSEKPRAMAGLSHGTGCLCSRGEGAMLLPNGMASLDSTTYLLC